MSGRRDPINPTTDEARALARRLLTTATFGALATNGTIAPLVTRVAVTAIDAAPHILVSTLSAHTRALQTDPACSILLGEPGEKGDPLTHPRMTVVANATQVDKAALRDLWLARHPKSALYVDFADFLMLRLDPIEIHLNGGFGKAFRLEPGDLR